MGAGASADIYHQAKAFVHVNDGDNIGDVSPECLCRCTIDVRITEYRSVPRSVLPLKCQSMAMGADCSGNQLDGAAIATALVAQHTCMAAFPERAGIRIRMRHRLIHQATPNTREQWADRMPPSPCTKARCAPSTCRPCASPRSWRTASTA